LAGAEIRNVTEFVCGSIEIHQAEDGFAQQLAASCARAAGHRSDGARVDAGATAEAVPTPLESHSAEDGLWSGRPPGVLPVG